MHQKPDPPRTRSSSPASPVRSVASDGTQEAPKVSRRTAINAVWSTPVIAAAVAAPRAAASQARAVSATSKVSVPLGSSSVWPAHQVQGGVSYGRLTIPYAPITLGLSFTNTGLPLVAGEAYILGLVTSVAKNNAGLDLFALSGTNNNGWTFVGVGTPQHAGPTTDAAYPIWFRYNGALATGATAPTVNFTISGTGATASNRYDADGDLLYPGEVLWSRAFINPTPPPPPIPAGTGAPTAEFRAAWSNTPLTGRTNTWYVTPDAG